MRERIAIASDHAGKELKDEIKTFLEEMNLEVIDLGTNDSNSVDYPDFGIPLAKKISSGQVKTAVLVCATGIGMSIVANKFANVRAALVNDLYTARMAKKHNDANILVIGGRVVEKGLAREMVGAWVNARFEGGRHQRRLDKISDIEKGWGVEKQS